MSSTRRCGALLALIALLALGACREGADPPPSAAPTTPSREATAPSPPGDQTGKPNARPFDPSRIDLDLRLVAEGLDAPLAITHAGDSSGDLYVAQQGGRIDRIDPENGTTEEFVDIGERTVPGGEQGLLGLAFHPDFEDNGRFFVNYTDEAGDTVIAELAAGPGAEGDPSSHKLVLGFEQPYSNHNGGQLAFGPDGYLYIGTGDGGSGGDPRDNGQSFETLLGKLLRIDVDSEEGPYSAPPDNPFVNEDGARPEIWALGLRNPWRFSFDRKTDELWVADVGQDILEEINRAPSGAGGLNYGWDEMEGSNCYEPTSGCDRAAKEIPVSEYSHDFGCSVTGGYVYRGSSFPDLKGAYVFGDFCSGTIWAVPADADAGTRPIELLQTEMGISSFGEGEDGEVYVSDLTTGRVFQLIDR